KPKSVVALTTSSVTTNLNMLSISMKRITIPPIIRPVHTFPAEGAAAGNVACIVVMVFVLLVYNFLFVKCQFCLTVFLRQRCAKILTTVRGKSGIVTGRMRHYSDGWISNCRE